MLTAGYCAAAIHHARVQQRSARLTFQKVLGFTELMAT